MRANIFRDSTMREWCARGTAAVAGLTVVALVIAVALLRNPPGSAQPTANEAGSDRPSTEHDIELRTRGERIYAEGNCAFCHSLRGKGNPSSPLDGVTYRLAAEEIRDRIIAADVLQAEMPQRAVAAKRAYRNLTREDLDALVAFLRQAP